MPVELKGLANTKRALKEFAPDLYKQMNDELKAIMLPTRNEARGYVPFKQVSGWMNQHGTWENRVFDSAAVKKGIVYTQGKSKVNEAGFQSSYIVYNKTAAGAIYETAGRANPSGQPWVGRKGIAGKKYSHSSNPKAGMQFINSMGGQLVGGGKTKGRLIYRAWAHQNNKAIPAGIKAINKAITEFNRRAKP
jgi:hypothetical protein